MRNKKPKSFVGYAIKINIVSILILVALCFFIFIEASLNVNRILPDLNYVVEEYKKYLLNDEYDKINLNRGKNVAFIVYDSNNDIVYDYNGKLMQEINIEDTNFIYEIHEEEFYIVYEYTNNNESKYNIEKTRLDENTGKYLASDYAILNDDLQIIEGNLFGEIREFNRIAG